MTATPSMMTRTAGCQEARCGDGIARADLDAEDAGYEYCDDGNTEDADAL